MDGFKLTDEDYNMWDEARKYIRWMILGPDEREKPDVQVVPFMNVEVSGRKKELVFLFINDKYRGIIELVNKDEL